MNNRSRIPFGTKLGFPKILIRCLETKIQVKAIAKDENYFTRLDHSILFLMFLKVLGLFEDFLEDFVFGVRRVAVVSEDDDKVHLEFGLTV